MPALEVVPGGYRAARGGPWLGDHNSREAPAALAPVREGSVSRARLLWAAALLLEMVAADAPGDPEAPASARSPWPGEPLTESETRVLYYLPTHLSARAIATELYLSANTVKTHQRHLYQKLGAHSREEAVQRARAIGLLTGSSRPPRAAAERRRLGRPDVPGRVQRVPRDRP